jgi:hypothetical protein
MLAHYHGQIWNAAHLARALDANESTTRRYLDLLEDLFMVRQLQPWHANLKKRQVKAPKIYLKDSGLLHQLLSIKSMKTLLEHPKIGASWEGYAVEQVLELVPHDEAYFWSTHAGAEIDLVLIRDGRLYGVECKRADAPRMTPSMRAANDLDLQRITVLYPGDRAYPLAHNVHVMPLTDLATDKAREIVSL